MEFIMQKESCRGCKINPPFAFSEGFCREGLSLSGTGGSISESAAEERISSAFMLELDENLVVFGTR